MMGHAMQMDNKVAKLSYSIPQAVAATGIGRSTLYGYIKARTLKSTKIGGRTVILDEDLKAWLNSFVKSA